MGSQHLTLPHSRWEDTDNCQCSSSKVSIRTSRSLVNNNKFTLNSKTVTHSSLNMVTLRKANNMGKFPPNILFTHPMANRISRHPMANQLSQATQHNKSRQRSSATRHHKASNYRRVSMDSLCNANQHSQVTRMHLNPNPSPLPISHLIMLHKTTAKLKLLSLINDQLVYQMFYHFIY